MTEYYSGNEGHNGWRTDRVLSPAQSRGPSVQQIEGHRSFHLEGFKGLTTRECDVHDISKKMKTTADMIYRFASPGYSQYPLHHASSHSLSLTHTLSLSHTLTLKKFPHKPHSPPTSSGSCFRSLGSTSTAPQKCRCTAFQSSCTSRHWQQCNTRREGYFLRSHSDMFSQILQLSLVVSFYITYISLTFPCVS